MQRSGTFQLTTLLLLCTLASCKDKQATQSTLFEELTTDQTGVDFANTVTEGEEFNVLSYRLFYNGAGVALGDFNGDGLDDLYCAANQGPNRLYVNEGNLQFREATGAAAGAMVWSTGVSTVDVNADGQLDIYVCNSGTNEGEQRQNELFVNQGNDAEGNPTFTEMADAYGLNDRGFSTQAAWFDYDGDGDLDVYLLNNSYLSPERINPNGENRNVRDADGGDKLLRNDPGPDGHPVFTDVSEEAGIFGSKVGFGLGLSLGDFDQNGWTDIYISNDFWERDYLYMNQGDGTFKEDLIARIDHVSVSSMGSDAADLDNDGDLEIFSTDMLPSDNQRLKASTLFDTYNSEAIKFEADYHHQLLQNCLQVNDGSGSFIETAHYSGVSATDWSWGALIFDMDNDGRKDIFVANGIYRDIMDLDFADFLADKDAIKAKVEEKGRYDWRDFVELLPNNPQPNYAFLNRGDLRFENVSPELGLGRPGYSNGAAYGDLDGDGDLELVVNNVNEPLSIYRNRSVETGRPGLRVRLTGPADNPLAVGARVTVETADTEQTVDNFPNRGFLSSSGRDLVFGLATDSLVRNVRVTWPNGETTEKMVRADQRILEVNFDDSERDRLDPGDYVDRIPLLDENQALLNVPAVHVEPFFNDFDYEALLLHKLSDPGPKVIKGDANGDGLEDFVLLGSIGYPEKLYLQRADGTFEFKPTKGFEQTKDFESSAGTFLDKDGDGDMDLLIATGGNEFNRGFTRYAVRYYENLGGGAFLPNQVDAPPHAGGEISCVIAEDIDFDGDVDLFLGARSIPGNYGLTPQSFLFIQEGGKWVKSTPRDIATAGLVTDAVWTDLNTDGRPDLVMVGEWMPITVAFMLNDGQISETFEIPNSNGWWTGVEAADLDGDGMEDLIATNYGLNTKFRASAERPLEMFVKDFDGNEKSEFIINWYPPADDRAYPFASKRELQGQLPGLRKKTLKYKDFAAATYESLFTEAERAEAISYKTEELRSSVIWNKGGGNVRIEPLPWQAQLTPQYGIAIGDVNADGKPDVFLGGNQFGMTPQMGRSDAGRGCLLLNAGDRNWRPVDNELAGVSLRGQIRDAQFIELATGGKALLVAPNNEPLRVYEVRDVPSR